MKALLFKGLILLLIVVRSYGQQWPMHGNATIPPSPTSLGIARITAVPVNHFTGSAIIDVPIADLKARSISIPIGLHYQASGVKVQDVAGPVGLGWIFGAGGMVTRVMKGRPDGSISICSESNLSGAFISKTCDPEADLFYFSLLGRSGQFYLTTNGTPATMPYQDIAIVPAVGVQSSADGSWKITDEKGFVYIFGNTPESREESEQPDIPGEPTPPFVSTWHLTSIITPEGFVVASFTYEPGADLLIEYYAVKEYFDLQSHGVESANFTATTKSPKYLKRITTSLGTANFSYSASRADNSAMKALMRINIAANTGSTVKEFNFIYDYFSEFVSQTGTVALRLSKIIEGPITSKTYYRSFEYHPGGIPARSSIFEDHWGYFNYNPNNQRDNKLPPGLTPACLPNNCAILKKSPDPTNIKAGILNRINYPTGGFTKLVYSMKAGGGVKIDSIKDIEGTKVVSARGFSYQNEQLFKTPKYYFTQYDAGTPLFMMVHSTSLTSLFDLDGTVTGFSKVTEEFLDGSKIERTFYNYSDYPDLEPEWFTCSSIDAYPASCNGQTYPNGHLFVPSTSNFWMRGLLKLVTMFDSQGNKLTEDEYATLQNFGYLPTTLSQSERVCMDARYTSEEEGVWPFMDMHHTFYQGTYRLRSVAIRPTFHTRRTYAPQNPNLFTIETTTFGYHSTHLMAVAASTKRVGLNGPITMVTSRYPSDLTTGSPDPTDPESAGMWSMVASNLIAPVETITYHSESGSLQEYRAISGSISTYRKSNFEPTKNHPVPYRSYELKIGSPIPPYVTPLSINGSGTALTMYSSTHSGYRMVSTVNYSDFLGAVASTSQLDGTVTSYEWDYAGSLMKKAIVNPGSNEHVTSFTHNTQLGVTSTTDPNLATESYEYDTKGRLKLVRDQDGNIVKRYRYHYRNELENVADFSWQPNNCSSVTLSCTSQVEPGSTFVWDFGDGNVKQNGSAAEVKTYAVGEYQVKLAVVHPEFPTHIATKTVRFLAPPSIAITTPSGLSTSPTICPSTNPGLSLVLTATPPSGGPFTYTWEYLSTGNWITFGVESSNTKVLSNTILFGPGTIKSIRCKISDANNGISCYSNGITVFLSCGSGGSGGVENCSNPGCYWDGSQCNCSTSCPEGYFWDGFQCVAY